MNSILIIFSIITLLVIPAIFLVIKPPKDIK
jgi:hypothetical protein